MTPIASNQAHGPDKIDRMSDTYQRFNLATMSGVFPGVRTMVYQRVRLRSLREENITVWARLLWYDEPPSCVVEMEERMDASAVQVTPLLRIPDPGGVSFGSTLRAALAAAGWQMLACGACAHWRPLATLTPDQLATGACDRRSAVDDFPPLLATQSLLAAACRHWQPGAEHAPLHPPPAAVAISPIPKRAERENDDRWTLAGQVRRWLGRKEKPSGAAAPTEWADRMVERSGVGAGTEPCFACQGRIANLGALAVATPEGDKQTFSVWRCRHCYTYYLNDWIDRWERTDNLETEERYYRLSPAEALEVLAVIENVVHAEHPARRHERNAQRQWILNYLAGQSVLSHQIRQGR